MEGCVEVDYMQSLMIDGDFSFPVYASSLFARKSGVRSLFMGMRDIIPRAYEK